MSKPVNPTCPICHAPCPTQADNKAYPFCSHRCQLVDLGRWLDGEYRIPGEPLDDVGLPDGEQGPEREGWLS